MKLKPNNCQVCACVRQDLGPRTHAKTRQTQKTRSRRAQKRAKHNTHTQHTHHTTTLCPPSSHLSLPTFAVPNSTPCATLWRCKGTETRNPASKKESDWWRGGEHTFLEAKKDLERQNHRFLFRDAKHTHIPIFPTCYFFFRFSVWIHIYVILSHNEGRRFFYNRQIKKTKKSFFSFLVPFFLWQYILQPYIDFCIRYLS